MCVLGGGMHEHQNKPKCFFFKSLEYQINHHWMKFPIMTRENKFLFIDEHVEFENQLVEVQDFRNMRVSFHVCRLPTKF